MNSNNTSKLKSENEDSVTFKNVDNDNYTL